MVPYKSSPAVLTALRAGEIDIAFEIVGPMLPQLNAGVVRALAIGSQQRNPALLQVPTAAQAGLPGYDVASWNALAAPAGTPPAVLATLGKAARDALATAVVRDRLAPLGVRVRSSTAAELQACWQTKFSAGAT